MCARVIQVMLFIISQSTIIAGNFEWKQQTADIVQYSGSGIDYVIFPWIYMTDTEPATINWWYETTLIMKKIPNYPALGTGGYENRVSYVTSGRCGDYQFSGCLQINSTTPADSGEYRIEVVTNVLPSSVGIGSLVYILFDESSSKPTLNSSCVVQIGDDIIPLMPNGPLLYDATYINTSIGVVCNSSRVPAAFITISQHSVIMRDCSEIPQTMCITDYVSMSPGTLTVTFDYLESWNPMFTMAFIAVPTIEDDLIDEEIGIYDPLNIECSFKALPQANISWHYNDSGVPSPDVLNISTTYTTDGNGYVLSSSVIFWKPGASVDQKKNVKGLYRCDAENGLNPVSSNTMMLYVQFGPLSIGLTPDTEDQIVLEGDTVTRMCSADCNPVCGYVWKNSTDGTVLANVSQLSLGPADVYWDGTYICMASNNRWGNSTQFTLSVHVKPTVVEDLENLNLLYTEDLQVECSFRCKPPSSIVWFFNGTANFPSNIIDITNQNISNGATTNSNSIIQWKAGIDQENRKTVSGLYQCGATNEAGVAQTTALLLNIMYPPGQASLRASNTTVVEGDNDLTLTCSVTENGNPAAHTYTWTNLDTLEEYTKSDNILTIPANELNVTKHEGSWSCMVNNTVGLSPVGTETITGNAKPVVLQNFENKNVTINSTLHIECSYRAKPEAILVWLYNGTADALPGALNVTSTSTTDIYTITTSVISWKSNSDLESRKAVSGLYQCHANNGVGGIVSTHNMMLNIQFGPISLDIGQVTTSVIEPTHVQKTCVADCNPSCSYDWTNTTDGTVISTTQDLILNPADRYDHTNFSCSAGNSLWGQSKQFALQVFFAPEPEVAITDENNLIQGNSTELKCSVESRPLSTVALKNMTDDSDLITDDNNLAVYSIPSVDCLQSGNYSCLANNDIPDSSHVVSKIIHMDIKCPPRISEKDRDGASSVGNNFTFEAHLISNPRPIITRNNWNFIQENDTKAIDLPPNVYIGEGQPETGERHTVVPQLYINEVDVYNFGTYILTTSNQIGGALSLQFMLTPEGPPLKPSKPRLMCGSATSLAINWTAEFNGGFQQQFSVMYSLNGGDEDEDDVIHDPDVNKGDIVQHKLQNLHQQTIYSIRIKAMNGFDGGRLTYGDPVSFETKETPMFVANPAYDFNSSHVEMAMSVQPIQSVDYIIIQMCTDVEEVALCSPEVNVPVTSGDLIVTLQLPEGKANSYKITINMFDCEDVVNTASLTVNAPNKDGNINVIAVACGVAAAFVVAVIIIVIILWRRGLIQGRDGTKKKGDDEIVHYENTAMGDLSHVYNEIPAAHQNNRTYQELDGYHKSEETSTYAAMANAELTIIESSCITVVGVISESVVYRVALAGGKASHERILPRKLVSKSVKDGSWETHKDYLLRSAEVMIKLVNCDNIIRCIGFSQKTHELLMEHIEFGNLRQYLTGVNQGTYVNSAKNYDRDILNFILQASNGAAAVAELVPEALFYCLSLDHILLGVNFNIKLTGFSLAQSVKDREEEECNLKLPRPLRWLAPEAINGRHCKQSDVWGFGVLMWETLSLGQIPFSEILDTDIGTHIAKGCRLEKPSKCSDDMFDLMGECWKLRVNNRPRISKVHALLLEATHYQNI